MFRPTSISITGKTINPDDPATPCGLIAKTFFNDTYAMNEVEGETIPIIENEIALKYDRDNYKNTNNLDK